MRVTDDSVQVDSLVADVKESVRLAGVSSASGKGDLRVESVQLIIEAVASKAAGGVLNFRIPVIGTGIRLGGKVARQNTHTIDMTLVPPERPPPRAVQGSAVQEALVDAIETIRETMASAAGGDDPWELSAGSVNISFAVTREGTISLGWDGNASSELAHRLLLRLAPSTD